MNREDFDELLTPERFSPFVVTTHDGFALTIGEAERRHALAGARMVVVMDALGDFIHIPYGSIAHISEPKQ